jgi:hypothetical protein
VRRHYLDNTNVLETTFLTNSGKVALTDSMPVTSEEEKKRRLWPEHELIRQIRCDEGEASIVSILILRGEITIQVFATRTIHRTANG